MTSKHTPTPWTDNGEVYDDFGCQHREIVGADGETVCGEFGGPNDDDAAHIVRAVNCFDELVEALRGLVDKDLTYKNGFAEVHYDEVQKARAALLLAKS